MRHARIRNPDKGELTTVESVDGKETSRAVHRGGSRPSVTRQVTGTDGKVLTEVIDMFPEGHEFAGLPQRIARPDGTIAIHHYESLPGGGRRATIEHGTGDENGITAGRRIITQTGASGRILDTREEPIISKD
jgi:hypothetical protein